MTRHWARLLLTVLIVSIAATVTRAFAPFSPGFLARSTTAAPGTDRAGSTTTTTLLAVRSKRRRRSMNFGGDSVLAETNQQRVATAGRKGSKFFVDPTKVFVGNLPFNATEDNVMDFLEDNLGHTRNVRSVDIIRDWKTGDSKGYGFVLFVDPIYATCAMEFCKNKSLFGRILTLSQGKKKFDSNVLFVKKKKKKKQVDPETAAIEEGLQQVEDFDSVDDAVLFADEDNDDDDGFDGFFEDFYPDKFEELTEEEQQLNREQRRDLKRRRKRRKLPHKGFQSP